MVALARDPSPGSEAVVVPLWSSPPIDLYLIMGLNTHLRGHYLTKGLRPPSNAVPTRTCVAP
jgi:hypothetical protein